MFRFFLYALCVFSWFFTHATFASEHIQKNHHPSSAHNQGKGLNMIQPQTFILKNHMLVVVLPDHRSPAVTQMVWYKVGSVNEVKGKTGLAHFLEHLMFKETKNIPLGDFSRVISRKGGDLNAFTSYDYTAYYERIAKNHLELVLGMEADRMQGLVLQPEEVDRERDVVIEERRMRVENSPYSILASEMRRALFKDNPYGEEVIGTHEDVQHLSRENALEFYKKYYTPSNAILVLAGDITADEAKPLVEKTFGALKNSSDISSQRTYPPVLPLTKIEHFEKKDPRVQNTQLIRVYQAPGLLQAGIQQSVAIDIAAKILGGDDLSRLYQQLVAQDKIATDVTAYYDSSTFGAGTFKIIATLVSDKPEIIKKADQEITNVIHDFLSKGMTDDELERAKTVMRAHIIYMEDSQMSMAELYGLYMTAGFSAKQIQAIPEDINGIEEKDIMNDAEHILNVKGYLKGTLLPEHTA